MVVVALKQGRGVQGLFHGQDVGVGHGETLELLIGVTLDVVAEGDHGAAQGGQDLLLDFLVRLGDVLDLLLAAVLVTVHGEHAQDEVLVFDLGGAHQGLEAVPVFSLGVVAEEAVLDLDLFAAQHPGDGGIGALGPLHGEVLVEGNLALRRGIGAHAGALEHHAVVVGGKADELLHGDDVVISEFGGADIGAVVGVVDFGLLGVGDHTLEGILTDDETIVGADPVLRGDDAVSEHDGLEIHGLAAHDPADAELEARTVFHALLIGDLGGVVEGLGGLGRNHSVVAGGVLALEALRLEGGFSSVPDENGGGFDHGLLGEVLGRERAGEIQLDLIATEDEGFGVHFEVELLDGLLHFSESATTGQSEQEGEGGEQNRQGLAEDVLHVDESDSGRI